MLGLGKKFKDPVCGMDVQPKTAVVRAIAGKTYYFCSEDCAKTYEDQQSGMHGHSNSGHTGGEGSHGCC